MASIGAEGTAAATAWERLPDGSPERWMRPAVSGIGLLADLRSEQDAPGWQRSLADAGFAFGGGEPWSSVFLRWVMERAGELPCREPGTRAWLDWGQGCAPRYGAVAVFADLDDVGPGHVGLIVGACRDRVHVLGGNTWERGRYAPCVGIRAYERASLLGQRCPGEARSARSRRAAPGLRLPRGLKGPARAPAAARGGAMRRLGGLLTQAR